MESEGIIPCEEIKVIKVIVSSLDVEYVCIRVFFSFIYNMIMQYQVRSSIIAENCLYPCTEREFC